MLLVTPSLDFFVILSFILSFLPPSPLILVLIITITI